MKLFPDFTTLSDEELILLVNEGNQRAFVYIYNKYWSEMYLCVHKIIPNAETCEDIIHDLFLSLWNSNKLQNIQSVRDYLYISVKNRALNQLRRLKVDNASLGEGHQEIPSDHVTDESLATKEIQSVFDMAISNLPEKCREIMILSRKEHLSNKEIASKLNISTKTVENQINIGLKKIRLEMKDFLILTFFFILFG
ncbi:RNA polymerase sigma factor [Pedobacter sp. MW01-1-1]|uniref:RNA polymerase sigma factor n=1 Tax=Pedobacter sp. MW01-1-1 TaxID=3383027 RepID=UPI003FF048C2